MYLFEWQIWRKAQGKKPKQGFLKRRFLNWVKENSDKEELKEEEVKAAELAEEERKLWVQADAIRATGLDDKGAKYFRLNESVSETPRAKGVLYAQTDRYLDVCTPHDNKRGFIMIAAVVFTAFFLMLSVSILINVLYDAFIRDNINIFLRFFALILAMCSLLFAIPYYFLARYIFRLEIFVQRRLIVRFDRVNRKVYFLRPNYAGGVVAQDWDKLIMPQMYGDDNRIGDPLILTWFSQESLTGRSEIVMIGHKAGIDDNLVDFWEFLRRFMEDGPQSVPREKLIGKMPWPWRSVKATFGGMGGIFHGRFGLLQLGAILMIPAGLFWAVAHWLSLLLCWEPVFPRAIRKATSESSFTIVEARLIDLVSWVMLAVVIWYLWPYIGSFLSDIFSVHGSEAS